MNFGYISILTAFVSSILAAIFFFTEYRKNGGKNKDFPLKNRQLSGWIFIFSVLFGLAASSHLLNAIFTHQFKYSYVAQYSSSDLPAFYLLSAFWAGQEGTFLLWAVMVGLMGLIFMSKNKDRDYYAMGVISAFTGFLYLLLLSKSPFDALVPAPPEGNGLNPLLQDPWMVIHPPILFLGYAATVFPFALVVSGMMRRNYENWFRLGMQWTLFSAVTLGAGIIIGGFWAYEVLGWGGYWGWDPVENSSLVPWLTLLVLLHGILIHKAKGSLQRTNIFFAVITFVLVIYATFLTRSGILSDFSVHSFSNLGLNNYLIWAMIISVVLGFGLFALRFREIKSPSVDHSTLNREVTLLISMYILAAAGIFTFIGMSSPIITGLLGNASQVDTSFYDRVNYPVAVAMAILLGISPLLGWTEDKRGKFIKRFSMPLVLTALACIIAYVAGATSWKPLLFIGSSAFGLITNVIVAFRQYRSGWLHIAGPISHIGVALLLIGIIGSGEFDESRQVALRQNAPHDLFGYQFTFKGMAETRAVKEVLSIEVSDGKNTFTAQPKLYYSEYNRSTMREPDIKILPLKDLYISPIELKPGESAHAHNPSYAITKGETQEMGPYRITFERFDMSQHGEPGAMTVGAVLRVVIGEKDYEVIPRLTFDEQGKRLPIPAGLPLTGAELNIKPQIALIALSVEEKKILLELMGFSQHMNTPGVPELVVDISIKPLMMVVWTGVVLIIAGTVIALRKRSVKQGT